MGSAASAKSFTRVVPADEPKQPQQPAERRVSDQSRTQTLGAAAATRTWTSATASKAARGVVVEGVEIPFQVREDDCVHFDDEVLASYSSWTAPVDNAPLHMALPPGRLEHEMNTRCVAQFMRHAARHRRHFELMVGRSAEND
ncbi:unnamed protein product [Durusdinium trenchii]|uniref:Uncharacterized protein n=2 Tax=Durusdinium trenchii TaxID=1381693 RepID=A0ABP0HIB8_9DINO